MSQLHSSEKRNICIVDICKLTFWDMNRAQTSSSSSVERRHNSYHLFLLYENKHLGEFCPERVCGATTEANVFIKTRSPDLLHLTRAHTHLLHCTRLGAFNELKSAHCKFSVCTGYKQDSSISASSCLRRNCFATDTHNTATRTVSRETEQEMKSLRKPIAFS